ncbi:hypothetical protein C2U54_00975 [Leclercia sp. LSNIH1]|nr:hypothetical protein C2U54_00975 [Leclercia sp. LSNIH1]POV34976.1 hypothetical protein C3388_09000 [Leclercia sp. LSNIH5]POW63144.1 hypothetical protein C3389_20170 [Leclercia sp. LSNIH2]
MLHPCRSRPLGASMRLAPACGQRLSDFQPDSRSLCLRCGLKETECHFSANSFIAGMWHGC